MSWLSTEAKLRLLNGHAPMSENFGGWEASADAWITELGDVGDYGRRHVLDAPMIARLELRSYRRALDIGCGEGRFCRVMRGLGIETVGVDPVEALLARARLLDPGGTYLRGRGETLDVAPRSFDLVVSYLSLIDVPDLQAAFERAVEALAPGGTLLVANLTSFFTAAMPDGWTENAEGASSFCIDHYFEERPVWVSWRGIRVQNWHRPLRAYMAPLLERGLILRHFAEPEPIGGDADAAARYRRVPFFHILEWSKPA